MKMNLYHIFIKLTTKKPEFREQPTYHINNFLGIKPAWYIFNGSDFVIFYYSTYRVLNELQTLMRSAPPDAKSIIYKMEDQLEGTSASVTYTFSKWIPFRYIYKYRIPVL